MAGQGNPGYYLEDEHDPETVWRSNCPTVSGLSEKVEEVLEDQVRRGQYDATRAPKGPQIPFMQKFLKTLEARSTFP